MSALECQAHDNRLHLPWGSLTATHLKLLDHFVEERDIFGTPGSSFNSFFAHHLHHGTRNDLIVRHACNDRGGDDVSATDDVKSASVLTYTEGNNTNLSGYTSPTLYPNEDCTNVCNQCNVRHPAANFNNIVSVKLRMPPIAPTLRRPHHVQLIYPKQSHGYSWGRGPHTYGAHSVDGLAWV